jgi:hypothetical protein
MAKASEKYFNFDGLSRDDQILKDKLENPEFMFPVRCCTGHVIGTLPIINAIQEHIEKRVDDKGNYDNDIIQTFLDSFKNKDCINCRNAFMSNSWYVIRAINGCPKLIVVRPVQELHM